jgi:hypothetical protein
MILRVIPSMAIGMNAAIKRKNMWEAITPGAALQTIARIGGMFFRELMRFLQLSLIGIFGSQNRYPD